MKILFIGDVYGQRGLDALNKFLPSIKQDTHYHFLIINGENVTEGLGINARDYKTLMSHGAHVITLGNHSFSKRELFDFIDDSNIIRPLNYPPNTPGKGVLISNFNGVNIAVINIMGQIFMNDPLGDPFQAMDDVLKTIDADIVIVDMHAEATSEKLALAHYLDGRVTAVIGTHTHVPTNDAMQLPKGTYYITDVGMTGVKYGILGADKDLVLSKFLTKMPVRLKPSQAKELQLNAVLIDITNQTIQTINKSD